MMLICSTLHVYTDTPHSHIHILLHIHLEIVTMIGLSYYGIHIPVISLYTHRCIHRHMYLPALHTYTFACTHAFKPSLLSAHIYSSSA